MRWGHWLDSICWKLLLTRSNSRASNFRQSRQWICQLEPLETRVLLTNIAEIEAVPFTVQEYGGVTPLASSSPSGFTPTQIRHAYGVDSITFSSGTVTGDGSGTTIAIVDAYDNPNITSDLAAFNSYYGLSSSTFTKVDQRGGTSYPAANSGWAAEIALDVQWAHAIAPKASILLVEADSASYGDLMTAVNYARNVTGVVAVSMSFGSGEFSGESSYDSYFLTPSGHTGITFVASSGDTGAPVSYPAISPNVLSVGGTRLTLTGSNTISTETGWTGSGGGISSYEAKPKYQNSLVSQSSTYRTNPDVAFNSDPNTGFPIYDSYNNGTSTPWQKYGGTSAAAPQWAGIVAIAAQGRIAGGKTALDSSTQLLPMIYSMSSSNFHDTTSGTSTGTPNYTAASGYDLVTGRGTPYANLVVSSLLSSTLTFTTSTLSNWTQNASGYSQTLASSNGTSPLTYSVSSGSLPNGLSLNATTGAITGTPTTTGAKTFTIKLIDNTGQTTTQQLSMTINSPLSITTTTLANWTQSLSGYSQTVATSGGTTALTYSLSTGALPAGLSLGSSTGALTGTPTTSGTSTFTIKAQDAAGATATKQYTVTVNAAISISTSSLANWTQNTTGYSQTVSTSGGTSTLTYSVSSGSLPSGLSLNTSTGVVSGTPTTTGTTTFTIKAQDTVGATATKQYTVTINSPVSITTTSLSNWTQSATGYSKTIATSGGTTALTFTVSVGSLPAGLSLNSSSGAITGTPTTAGNSTFTIKALDAAGASATKQYTVTINSPLSITTSSLANWTTSTAGYSQTVATSGGTTSFTYSISVGSLPSGLSLNTTSGAITGTPTTSATSTFTVKVVDAAGASAIQQYTMAINAPLSITTATLANWTQNTPAFSQTVATSGGTPALTFSLSSGTLPAGLSLNSGSGAITGTPTTAAASTFTVKVLDAAGATASQQYTVTINSPLSITASTLGNWTQNIAAYSQTVSTSGGTTALTFSLSSGTLPSGLSLNAGTGSVTGTPTAAATSTFTVSVVDAAGAAASQQYTVTINAPLSITTATVADWTQNISGYSQTVATSGGTTALTYSVLSGALPDGLSLNASTGSITGTPTTVSTSTFTIQVIDAVGSACTQPYILTINAPLSITTTALSDWTEGATGYDEAVAITGGTADVSYSVSTGTLPSGLSLDASSGVVTGTPDVAGDATFTILVVDAAGASASQQFSITIEPPLAITLNSLANWTQNIEGYSQTLSTSGGVAPLSFGVSTGSLPSGLTLDAGNGDVTGTPDALGSSTFIILVTDAIGATASQQYTVTIAAPVSITTTSLADWTQSQSGYSRTISTTDGSYPLTFSVESGNLPAGLSLNAQTGVISGTPDTANDFTFKIQVMDTAGAADTQQYTVTINPPLDITTNSLPNAPRGTAYSQSVSVSGGTNGRTYSVSTGSLPGGLSLDSTTGAIAGTPTATGTASFSISVVDGVGASVTQSYTIAISAPVSISSTTLTNWTQNQSGYSQSVGTSGGANPLTFSVSSGTLPIGLSLNSTSGAVTGTPGAAGNATFTITVQDAVGTTASQQYSVTINPAVSITSTSLPNWTRNLAGYSQTVATSGGTAPLTFAVSTGTLPNGLSLNTSTGAISGTPTVTGGSTFTVQVRDATGSSMSHSFTITINAAVAISATSLANWTQNVAGYSQNVAASGGTSTLTYSVSAGSLPGGLSLNTSTGSVTGTPTTTGSATFTIKTQDSVGATATKQYSVTINAPVSITTPSLTNWTKSLTGYSQSVATTGGTGLTTFSVSSGSLPQGLSLNASTGAITGTPGTLGATTFSIKAQDSVGGSSTRSYTVTINTVATGAWTAVASPTKTAVNSVTITFSAAVQNVSLNDFTLNGTDVSSLPGTSLVSNGNAYTIGGLAASDSAGNPSQAYTIAVAAGNNIKDVVGAALSGTASVSWVMDVLAPTGTWANVTSPTRTALNTVSIQFSEAVQNASLANFTLNGVKLDTLSGVTISGNVATHTYTISGLAAYVATGSPATTYTVAVPTTNTIKDAAGNAFSGTPSVAWVMDTVAPSATWNATTTPTRTATSSVSVRFSEAVQNASLANFTLNGIKLDTLSGVSISGNQATNTYTITGLAPYDAAGNPVTTYTVAVVTGNTIKDPAGNALSGTPSQSWTMDTVAPTGAWSTVATAVKTAVNRVTFTLSESAPAVALSDFVLNGTKLNTLTGVALSHSGNVYTLGGLSGFTGTGSPNTTYTLAVASGNAIKDAAGNALSGTPGVTWKMDAIAPTATWTAVATPTKSAVASVAIKFTEAVQNATLSNFTLNGVKLNTLSGVTIAGNSSTNTYTISGLSPYDAAGNPAKTYVVAIPSSNTLKDLAGNPLSGTAVMAWTMDTVAPTATWTQVTTPTKSAVASVAVKFSEAVQNATLANFALNGVKLSTLSGVTISANTSTNTYTIGGLSRYDAAGNPVKTYAVAVPSSNTLKDLAGNPLSGVPVMAWSMDTVVPTATWTAVATPTKTAVSSVTVTFSEVVQNVSAADFTLNGTSLGTLSGVTVTSSSGGKVYVIGGLSAYDSSGKPAKAYTVAVASGNDIKDPAGNALSGTPSVAWTLDTAVPVGTWTAVATPRNTALDSVKITFSETVKNVSLASFTLNGMKISTLSGTALTGFSGNAYVISGLAAFTAASKSYTVALASSSGILDTAGNAPTSTPSVSWVMDAVLPTSTWTAVTSPTRTAVSSVAIQFTEAVQNATLANFTLNGVKLSTLSGVSISANTSTNTYTIGGLSAYDSAGNPAKGYTVAVITGNTIKDLAGNALSGRPSVSWTMDTVVPTGTWGTVAAARNAALTAETFTLSEAATVALSDFTLNGTKLSTLSGVTLSRSGNVYTLGGLAAHTGIGNPNTKYKLAVVSGNAIKDPAGNALAGTPSVSWTMDTVRPTGTWAAVATPRPARVDSVTIAFTEVVQNLSLSAFTLNGTNLSTLSGLAVSISGTSCTIVGMSAFQTTGNPAATYTLAVVSGNTLKDQAGNAFSGTPSVTWVVDAQATFPSVVPSAAMALAAPLADTATSQAGAALTIALAANSPASATDLAVTSSAATQTASSTSAARSSSPDSSAATDDLDDYWTSFSAALAIGV